MKKAILVVISCVFFANFVAAEELTGTVERVFMRRVPNVMAFELADGSGLWFEINSPDSDLAKRYLSLIYVAKTNGLKVTVVYRDSQVGTYGHFRLIDDLYLDN